MKNGRTETNIDVEPNSKPYLFKRIISDGTDTAAIFLLFLLISYLLFASPLAGTYNAHYENAEKIKNGVVAELGDDAQAITDRLNGDVRYNEERFAANLHSYLIKLLAGFIAEAAVLLLVPLVSRERATPGKLLTGLIPFNEKRQTKAARPAIFLRFLFIFIIDSAIFYLFTGIFTFLLIPVLRLIEMLFNKKNKTVCDALTGVMIIEKLSYNGIDK